MTHFQVVPERSQLWIEAQSSLHPIHAEATGIYGEAEISLHDGSFDLDPAPRAWVALAVDQLHSGNSLQDQEMLRTIEAAKFPTITAQLLTVQALQHPQQYRVQSHLTLHGVTRKVQAEVTARLAGEQTLIVEGECTLDMRDYGVTPPRLLWILQVHPVVKIRLRIIAERRA